MKFAPETDRAMPVFWVREQFRERCLAVSLTLGEAGRPATHVMSAPAPRLFSLLIMFLAFFASSVLLHRCLHYRPVHPGVGGSRHLPLLLGRDS